MIELCRGTVASKTTPQLNTPSCVLRTILFCVSFVWKLGVGHSSSASSNDWQLGRTSTPSSESWVRADTSLSAPNDARQELPARAILSQRSWRHRDIRNGRYGQGIVVACDLKTWPKIRDKKQDHDTIQSEVNVSFGVGGIELVTITPSCPAPTHTLYHHQQMYKWNNRHSLNPTSSYQSTRFRCHFETCKTLSLFRAETPGLLCARVHLQIL